MRRWLFLIPLLLALLAMTAIVQAQEGNPDFPSDDDVNVIAKQLYCPVCPNTPLDVCETQACQDWRDEIRGQLAAGWTEAQILNYFVEQYGERVLAEPRRQGFTSLVWLLPVILTLLGLYVLTRILKSWKIAQARAPAFEVESPPIPPETLAKIEEEVEDMW
ncbi:MAG: cytochrome c-type biogenesis protein CcmH [Chloroflexi bacterium]|nr:cytochrome c-type biogenesis protein CcmH [Chloroflexota bacterium]